MLEDLKQIEIEAQEKELQVGKPKTVVSYQELSPEMREFNRQMTVASTLAKSTIVPVHFRGKPNDIYATVMLGSELGFQPMMALNSIVVIQGTATLKAQTMLAVVYSKCPNAVIDIKVDEENKVAVVTAKRNPNESGYMAMWNMDKAKAMGLSGRDNWIKQPTTMLRWRAVSEAVRMVFADVLMGIYSTEEIIDLSSNTSEVVNLANETFKA